MSEAIEVRGVVEDREGTPIGGAVIHLEAQSDAGTETRTVAASADGRFVVPARAGQVVWLWSEPQGYAPGVVRVMPPTGEVRIEVTPESVLVGRIVEQGTDRPLPHIDVQVDRSTWNGIVGNASARTDAQGRFAVHGLTPGRHEVQVTAQDWQGKREEVPLAYRGRSEEVTIEAVRGRAVSGRVIMPPPIDDTPRSVWLLSDGAIPVVATLDHAGRFEARGVLPGRWKLEVAARPFIEQAPVWVEVGGADVRDLEIRVRRGARITGRVRDARAPVPGLQLHVYAAGRGERFVADAQGCFTVEGLRPGKYRIEVDGQKEPREVIVQSKDVEVDLLVEREAKIRGRIVDPDGHPIDRTEVTLVHHADGHEFHTCGDFVGAADGHFVFERLHSDTYTLVPERYGLGELRSEEGGSARVKVAVIGGETRDVEIVVERLNRAIEGRVVDGAAQPAAGVLVAVARETEDEDQYGNAMFMALNDPTLAAVTNDEGRFRLPKLGDGTFSVVAYRPGRAPFVAKGVSVAQRLTIMLDD